MKEISQLSKDLETSWGKLVRGLMSAQSMTANDILDDLRMNANMDTSEFVESIYRTETKYDGETIETFIGSDLQVTSSEGKKYNLGWLLEVGTSPHTIRPVNKKGLFWGEYKDGDPDKPIIRKRVEHPGTIAYNNYRIAKNNATPQYRERIKKAIKEAMK